MPGPIKLSAFTNAANGAFSSTRDIVLGNNAPTLGFFGRRTITSGMQRVNRDTMTAFRDALAASYGVFGMHAFDGILGSRLAFGKSLRARDIKAVTILAPQLAKKALENEVVRQLQSSPQYFRLHAEEHPQTVAKAIVEYAYAHRLIADNLYPKDAEGHRDFKAFLQRTQDCIQSGASNVIDAVLEANGGSLPEIDQREIAAEESGFSAFAHYAEQHIVKLDYNESQDTLMGSHRTSERTKLKQGRFYHYFRTSSTKEANIGAVSEVLANDLMAKAGIPSQELVLRHAGWSDGRSKLLLEGTVAKGYTDLDKYLRDGRLVTDGGKPLGLQDFGKYKIMLLLFGDRDGVGSQAQNKGCIGNRFFAIDPGHSLEGKQITFSTDFSFTANADFKNYSIFDDTSRAEKFRGVLEIRRNLVEALEPHVVLRLHVTRNFEHYREIARKQDRATRDEMLRRIDDMEREFIQRIKDIMVTFKSQLALYDAIAGDGNDPERVRDDEAAIEAEATLEKLASSTSCRSRNGEVQLRHLEVAPRDRKPTTIRRDANGGYTITLGRVKQDESDTILNNLKLLLGKDAQHNRLATYVKSQTQHDRTNDAVTLKLDAGQFREFIYALKEEDIYRLKHPTDFATRP